MKKIYKVLLMLFIGIFALLSSSFGQNEYYLDFDGNNDYVKYSDDATLELLDAASDYTIETWIYPVDGTIAEYDRVLQRYNSFKISMWDGNNDGNVEDWYFSVSDGSGSFSHFNTDGDATLTLDAWNHIAIINNSAEGSLKLYVNGVDVTQSGGYSNMNLRTSAGTDNLYIGQIGNGASYFGGYIDEVRLKNTAENIVDLNTNKFGNQYTSDINTAVLFHFNEGSGTNTINSASSTNATLNNGPVWTAWNANDHLPLACEWTAASGSDWSTSGSWNGGVPTSSNDVIIANTASNSAYIQAATTAECNNITIESTMTVWLYNDGSLNVNGDLNIPGYLGIYGDLTVTGDISTTLNDDIRVYCDETNQGSIIHNNTGVGATVERNITAYTPGQDDDGWHLLSAPVDNFAISGSHFEPESGSEDLYTWDEDAGDAGMWINYHNGDNPFTNFTNGQGYLCAYNTSSDYEFSGDLNASPITHNNLSATYDRWHLLGNPFACALDWSKGDWELVNVSIPQVYVEAEKDYFALDDPLLNGNENIIPSTQGFFVRVADPSNNITIPLAARVHEEQNWYKKKSTHENTLALTVHDSENNKLSHTSLTMNEDASTGYDIEFDSYKIFGSQKADMYTLDNNQDAYSYNNIPFPIDEMIIPLNMNIYETGVYTINVAINTLNSEGDVFLEDLETGMITNLSTTDSYSFSSNESDDANRFMLHFNSINGIDDLTNNNKVNIYANDHSIYLNAEESINGEIMVYDMGGKLILSEKIQNTNMHRIAAEALNGVYLVRLIEAGHISTQKVIIQ